jgi:hypothetical protein
MRSEGNIMRHWVAAFGLALGLSLLTTSQASAGTFDLNDVYCNCLPSGSSDGGTVTLNDLGDSVEFNVDLSDSLNFHYTNAFDLFAFNYSGAFAESSFSITGAPSGWVLLTEPTGNASMNGAGKDFDLYINCPDCTGQGGGISGVNVLMFTLSSSAGPLDLAAFETTIGDGGTNNNNFAATVTQTGLSGCTGVLGGGNGTGQSAPIASTGLPSGGGSCGGGTTVPDGGSTAALLGFSMLAVAYVRRRSRS